MPPIAGRSIGRVRSGWAGWGVPAGPAGQDAGGMPSYSERAVAQSERRRQGAPWEGMVPALI